MEPELPGVQTSEPDLPLERLPAESQRELPPNLNLGGSTQLSDVDVTVASPEHKTEGLFGGILSRVMSPRTATAEEKPRRGVKKERGARVDVKGEKALRPILSVIIILAFTAAIGETLAPNDEEAEGMAAPLARIIARHLPVPEELSDDFYDLMEFGGALTGYYMRVRPALKHVKQIKEAERAEHAAAAAGELAGGNGRRSPLGSQLGRT
jgi:hypothetical protein